MGSGVRQDCPTTCVSLDKSAHLSEPGETDIPGQSVLLLSPRVKESPNNAHALRLGQLQDDELYPGDQIVLLEGWAPLDLSLGAVP